MHHCEQRPPEDDDGMVRLKTCTITNTLIDKKAVVVREPTN